MENLQDYYSIVEESIRRAGLDCAKCRGEKEGQWNIKKGEFSIWLDLWHIETEGRAYFQVMAPVLEVPAKNKDMLFEELLSINDSLFGVAFTLYKNWIYLKVIREAMGMDVDEAYEMILRVGNYTEDYLKKLQSKYLSKVEGDRRYL